MKKDSVAGCDGMPNGICGCAGLGSKFLLHVYKVVLEKMLFLIVCRKKRQSLSLRLLTLVTLERLFDHLMHFVHGLALVVANSSVLLFCQGNHWCIL